MPPPTTRITLDELRALAAEVFGVDMRAVTVPWHDTYAVHIGVLWSAPVGPHVEYRSIDVALRGVRDATGSTEGTHAFNVLFDVLEGILRRRSAARGARPPTLLEQTRELEPGPPSSVRPRLAPKDAPLFTEARPSEPPEKDE